MPSLSRRLNLPLFTFYGLGSILGAGIYALVGKVAGEAGVFAPLSFVIAAVMAALTGFSYAELSSRFPKSGGESVYVSKAFGIKWLSFIVGILVIISATVSSAALMNAFVGYLEVFVPVTRTAVLAAVAIIAALIAVWGIKESAAAAAVFTLIEIGGLILIIWVGKDSIINFPSRLPEFATGLADLKAINGILLGAFLAFYACIGFEDMANVAEEVINPHRNLPLGIIIAIAVSTILYFLVSAVAVLSLDPEILKSTDAPLALVYEQNTGSAPFAITLIGLFAVSNGILIQIIMGSRMIYGLSNAKCLPKFLSYVSPRTHTPVSAILLISLAILALAIGFDLANLAEATSFTVLLIFILVNLACIVMKIRDPEPKGVITFPFIIPLMGLITVSLFLGYRILADIG